MRGDGGTDLGRERARLRGESARWEGDFAAMRAKIAAAVADPSRRRFGSPTQALVST